MTLDEMKALPKEQQDKLFEQITQKRKAAKTVTYSATYGVGAKKLSRTTGMSLEESTRLLDAYWQRNWAVPKAMESIEVRHLRNGEMWAFNPVSKLYYSLRFEKDKFSTINQGTGSYVFDTWVKHCRDMGIKFCGQFHDEHISPVRKGDEEEHEKKLQEALDKTNDSLKLNVSIHMEAKFGSTYAEVH